MAFAVELYLDANAERIIRQVWKTIAGAGISDSMMGEGFYPHITLGIANRLDKGELWPALSNLARQTCPLRLVLSHIGIFPNVEGVVYLGATVTQPLLEFHAAAHHIFDQYAQEPWAYYQTENWVPHCTVAFGLSPSGVTQVVSLCMQTHLPLQIQAMGIGVAEVLPNRARTIFVRRMDDKEETCK